LLRIFPLYHSNGKEKESTQGQEVSQGKEVKKAQVFKAPQIV